MPRELLIAIFLILSANLASFCTSDAGTSEKILNLRRNVSFLLVFFVFVEIGFGFKKLSMLHNLNFLLFAFVAIFGAVEYVAPDSFWNHTIGIPAYWREVALDPFSTDTIAESGRFYSWDLVGVFGQEIRRMVSIYLEPTTLAAFFVFCYCISLYPGHLFVRVAVLIAGLLTISKFFLISAFLASLLFNKVEKLPKQSIFLLCIFSLLFSILIVAIDLEHGALAHLKGMASLVNLFSGGHWFGLGLGGAGNYSDLEADTADIGGESGFGNIVAQLGISAIFYLMFLNSLFVYLLKQYKINGHAETAVGLVCLVCWIVSFLLSASSLGLSGNAFFFIYLGVLVYRADRSNSAD